MALATTPVSLKLGFIKQRSGCHCHHKPRSDDPTCVKDFNLVPKIMVTCFKDRAFLRLALLMFTPNASLMHFWQQNFCKSIKRTSIDFEIDQQSKRTHILFTLQVFYQKLVMEQITGCFLYLHF